MKATDAALAEQAAIYMLGYRDDTAEHSRREHGVTAAAAPMVANSWCQSCKKNFRSKSRIIHHLQYGALACRLMFASGTMILPDREEVERQVLAHVIPGKEEGTL